MARLRAHLRNAPIVEAVLDFRVLRRDGIQPQNFAALESLVGERYPEKSAIQSIEAKFGFMRVEFPAPGLESLGFRYRGRSEVAQFRVDGFTFSRIEPYTTWEEVFGEASRLWQIYTKTAEPRELKRVAVRYINRMKIEPGTDLRNVLEAPPFVPAPIPQTIREFLTRVYIDDESRLASAVIVQALERGVNLPGSATILLDIDAFRNVSTTASDPELPAIFQRLRELKNEIFFGSITEERAEIYE